MVMMGQVKLIVRGVLQPPCLALKHRAEYSCSSVSAGFVPMDSTNCNKNSIFDLQLEICDCQGLTLGIQSLTPFSVRYWNISGFGHFGGSLVSPALGNRSAQSKGMGRS